MKQFTFSVTIFYIIFGLCYEASLKEIDWLNDLIKYIKNDNREYQILILVNKTNKSLLSENIVRRISKQMPALEISFEEFLAKRNKTSIVNIRTSMVIIIHFSADMDQLNRTVEMLTELSGSRIRPRCLICLPKNQASVSYKNILIKMWNKRFLDTTIIEFSESKKNTHLLKNNRGTSILSMYHYNPFRGTYNRVNNSESLSWFPEKTHDLHGQKLKVGLIHVPPFVHLEHDNNSKLVKAYGTDVSLTQALAKVMNFSITWNAPAETSEWGSSLNCTKENSTGLLYKLMHNELDFMGFENGRYSACYEQFYEHSKSTKFAKISIVVPIFRAQADVTLNSSNLLYIVLFVVLFVFTWAISYFILYKPPSLSILQVGRIVFGTTAPNEPAKPAERFVFAAILLSCMLQASFIYTLIAENNLKLNFKPEPETIEDVLSFNLLPVIGKDYYLAFKGAVNDTSIHTLLDRANTNITIDDCLLELPIKKGAACITRSEVAQKNVENNKDSCGRSVLKILNEFLRFTASGMNMEAGSPLVRRFDKVIQKFIESGLVARWQQEKFSRSSVLANSNATCSETFLSEEINIKSQIIYIFTVGYVCAVVAFFMEVLNVKCFH